MLTVKMCDHVCMCVFACLLVCCWLVYHAAAQFLHVNVMSFCFDCFVDFTFTRTVVLCVPSVLPLALSLSQLNLFVTVVSCLPSRKFPEFPISARSLISFPHYLFCFCLHLHDSLDLVSSLKFAICMNLVSKHTVCQGAGSF